MKIAGNEISVGGIRLHPFNRLKLTDVYVADLKNDTLLYIKDFSAEFSLWPLLSSKLQINSVTIDDFTVKLYADSTSGNLNFQFLIDAFSSDEDVIADTATSGSFIMNLNNISLVNGRVSYDILSEPSVSKSFDYNHIDIDSLQLSTDFNFTSVEDFMVKLKHLSLNESSGFSIRELTADISAADNRMQLNNFLFRLTKSEVRVDSAYIDYSQTTIDSLATKATFSLPVSQLVIHPSDVKMFYLPLEKMRDSLLLGAEVEGYLPAVNLKSFYLIYGRAVSLDANAFVENYIDWETSPLELNIAQLLLDFNRINGIARQLASGGMEASFQVPVNTNFMNLKTLLKGILPDLQIDLKLLTSSGQLDLNGNGGYLFSTGDAHINASLKAEDLNLQQLLDNPLLGMASLNASVKGNVAGSGDISGTLTADIGHFDFNDYAYHDIHTDALYVNDSIHLLVESRDTLAPLWLKAKGKNISSVNPYLYLEAEARHIMLDSLNFIPQYKGADLYANIRAEVEGFDLDKMKAGVSIDSLRFRTDRGVFYQDSVRLKADNEEGGYKAVSIAAPLIEASAFGNFSFSRLPVVLGNSLAQYFSTFIPYQTVDTGSNDEINLYVLLRNTEYLSNALDLPVTIPDSVMVSAYYNNKYNNIMLSAAVPRVKMGEMEFLQTVVDVDSDTLAPKLGIFGRSRLYQGGKDTIRLAFGVKALKDSVNLRVFAGDSSDAMELYALVDTDIHFTEREEGSMPLIDAGINPGAIFVNRQRFNILPSAVQVNDSRYTISKFELADTSGGNLKVDGVVSASGEDTLKVDINQLYISSVMAALQSDIDLKGEVNADIVATGILSNPIVSTNYFNVDSISLNNKQIGNLELGSAWNNQQQAVMLDAELWQTNGMSSRINGYVYPIQNKLSLNASFCKLALNWTEPLVRDFLFGLSGALGLELTAEGQIGSPMLEGELFFDNAGFGVKTTNVKYKIADTISITPDKIMFNQFEVVDDANNTAVVTGNIRHKAFSNFNLDLGMRLRNFLLLNNSRQTDSMIYGKLALNGDVNISGTDKNILTKASVSNSGSGKVLLQLPESARTAQQYTGITYINTEKDSITTSVDSVNRIFEAAQNSTASLPLRVELALTLTPQLTMGMVLNPATGDIANVSGNGDIQLVYDMMKDEMSLHGDYTVEKGDAAFSFQNVLKKQFQLAKGGKVTFRGDPMATRFNATALYNIRADLATLDESFTSDPYLSSTRVQVSCLINIVGDINQMTMSYDIQIPNVDESVQRKVAGLLYNDDLKIKQIAYLLALGRFYPPEGVVGASSSSTSWTSILSSTLSTQLNNLLSNVLNENWSVGTELRTGENGTDNIEANVIVSANLFNDRVTVTTNLGYKNTTAAEDDFTGDFSVEYKLTKTGEWVVKAYNATNDQFYEQAPTTQGIGVVYKKEAPTFKQLFKKRRRRGNRQNREAVERNRTRQERVQQEETK